MIGSSRSLIPQRPTQYIVLRDAGGNEGKQLEIEVHQNPGDEFILFQLRPQHLFMVDVVLHLDSEIWVHVLNNVIFSSDPQRLDGSES